MKEFIMVDIFDLDLWTQCQRCQGSLISDVICQNKDCPIFYKRIKIQKEFKECNEKIAKFDEPNDW